MRIPRSGKSRVLAWSAAALLAALSGGCLAPRNELAVRQPFAPPAQRQMTLASDWGWWDVADGRTRVLLAFPLPGARSELAPRDFLLYVTAPAGVGTRAVSPADADGARGFFIQRKGTLAGKTLLESGELTLAEVPFQAGMRRLSLNVVTADGARLQGDLTVAAAPHELKRFEAAFAADVVQIASPQAEPPHAAGGTQAETTGPPTASRPSGRPSERD